VSPARKLFIAAVLVVIGLGVAHFLGEPTSLTQAPGDNATTIPRESRAAGDIDASKPSNVSPPLLPGRVRLMPQPTDAESTNPTRTKSPALVTVTSPTLPHPSPNLLGRPTEQPVPLANSATHSPQVKLRDEAPRPIGVEPRPPAVVRRMPPIESVGNPPIGNATTDWSSAVQADFTSDRQSTPAIQTSFSQAPLGSEAPAAISPPPWPAPDEGAGPRKHIIVDGDSLARLAERYLQDAQRGHEIFELNRELLSNPDLLPIGAELTIPDRLRNNGFDRQGDGVMPALNAASKSLTPVRPIPTTTGVSPRAQLAPPRSLD
jgi:hypothetical protein